MMDYSLSITSSTTDRMSTVDVTISALLSQLSRVFYQIGASNLVSRTNASLSRSAQRPITRKPIIRFQQQQQQSINSSLSN